MRRPARVVAAATTRPVAIVLPAPRQQVGTRRRVFGFFSFAHEDDTLTGGAVSGLRVALENAVKLRVRHFELYQDTKDLKPGSEWKESLFGAIDASVFFLPVLSPGFFESQWCRGETERALARRKEAPGRMVIPLCFARDHHFDAIALRRKDKLRTELHTLQYSALVDTWHAGWGSEAGRAAVAALANDIVERIARAEVETAIAEEVVPLLAAGRLEDAAATLRDLERPADAAEVERIARLGGEAQVDAAKAHVGGYLGAGWAVFAEEAGRRAERERAEREAVAEAARIAREEAERAGAAEAAKVKAEREAREAVARETAAKAAREKAEREAREKAEREAAARAAKENAEREAQEKAEREAVAAVTKEKAEREAREKAEREAAARAAKEKAERPDSNAAAILASFGRTVMAAKLIEREAPARPGARSTLRLGAVALDLAYIPAGTFKMGSPDGVGVGDEHPQHEVRISRPFRMGVVPVTQAQWVALMKDNPSNFKGDQRPVETVTWFDAVRWCNAASAAAGLAPAYTIDGDNVTCGPGATGFRLPTEAEWEYACRAGTTTRWSHGDDEGLLAEYTWYGVDGTRDVGQRRPNPWGLYDVHGNVWEWCDDGKRPYPAASTTAPAGAPGDGRVIRGGGWGNTAVRCRSAYRFGNSPDYRNFRLGFRVVLPFPRA